MQQLASGVAMAAMTLALAACGGGRTSGEGIAFTPPAPQPPILTPAPSPSPAPVPPPLPSGRIGLSSDKPFATVSAWTDGWGTLTTEAEAVRISYSAADDRYTVKLPEYQEGPLVLKGRTGSFNAAGWINLASTTHEVTAGAGSATQPVGVTLDWPASSPFTYTNFGSWHGPAPMGEKKGVFAYSVPTSVGDVPVVGSASYTGEIRGVTSGERTGSSAIGPLLYVFGSVFLSFNFESATLTGQMKPLVAPVWDHISLGTYTFRDTVYSAGSTSFAGAFDVPGSSGISSFSGRFTGPGAAELMAIWQAPFIYPGSTDVGRMSGVWIAKKGN